MTKDGRISTEFYEAARPIRGQSVQVFGLAGNADQVSSLGPLSPVWDRYTRTLTADFHKLMESCIHCSTQTVAKQFRKLAPNHREIFYLTEYEVTVPNGSLERNNRPNCCSVS